MQEISREVIQQLPMALLDCCELLALLRVDETSKKETNEKENMKCEKDDILKEGEFQKETKKETNEKENMQCEKDDFLKENGLRKEENKKENMKCEKDDILKESELQKEALKQASVLGDSALYRCHKKCERIKQLTGGILKRGIQ